MIGIKRVKISGCEYLYVVWKCYHNYLAVNQKYSPKNKHNTDAILNGNRPSIAARDNNRRFIEPLDSQFKHESLND